jgi:hypothetical protein
MFLPNITIKVITFLNQQTGWGLGGRELVGAATGLYVLKTTNTGNNWNVICSDTATYGTYTRVNDAEFINENVGYYVGRWGFAPPPSSYYGILNKTTNGGISWFFPGGFSNNYSVEAITFVNYQTGFAVGDHNLQGIIYKTTNALGLETISSSAPSDFSLSQNYPNPFNPQTKINFDIPKSSFTQIIIYDLLGREVATLVNEELKAGTYEADWDASGFSSGVYFYKITAGDFIETKKMVLMK